MNIATHCDLSLDTFVQGADIVRDAGSKEIAMAFFTEPGSSPRVQARGFEAYDDQNQSSSSVSYGHDTVMRAKQSAQEKGWVLNRTGHQHMEEEGHAHAPSTTDKNTMDKTVDNTITQIYPLFYTRSDGGVDIKMYNNNHQAVDMSIDGKRIGKIASIDRDNNLQQAA